MADQNSSLCLHRFSIQELLSKMKELLKNALRQLLMPAKRFKILHERGESVQEFSWGTSIKPSVEPATGLLFLHSSEKKIIHTDFKTSNILLDNKGEVLDVNDDWDGKMSSQLQYKSTGCNLNKYDEPFSQDKRKKTVQLLLSCLITTIVFLWIIFDICIHSSIIQLQPMHKQHGLLFIWSSFLEPMSFMVFIWAIVATIVVGAPFSRMQSAMLMIWAILMLLRSAKSITEVYVPIMGILFTGCYVLVGKQPELPN